MSLTRILTAACLAASLVTAQEARGVDVFVEKTSKAKKANKTKADYDRVQARLAEVIELIGDGDLTDKQRAVAREQLLQIVDRLKAQADVKKKGAKGEAVWEVHYVDEEGKPAGRRYVALDPKASGDYRVSLEEVKAAKKAHDFRKQAVDLSIEAKELEASHDALLRRLNRTVEQGHGAGGAVKKRGNKLRKAADELRGRLVEVQAEAEHADEEHARIRVRLRDAEEAYKRAQEAHDKVDTQRARLFYSRESGEHGDHGEHGAHGGFVFERAKNKAKAGGKGGFAIGTIVDDGEDPKVQRGWTFKLDDHGEHSKKLKEHLKKFQAETGGVYFLDSRKHDAHGSDHEHGHDAHEGHGDGNRTMFLRTLRAIEGHEAEAGESCPHLLHLEESKAGKDGKHGAVFWDAVVDPAAVKEQGKSGVFRWVTRLGEGADAIAIVEDEECEECEECEEECEECEEHEHAAHEEVIEMIEEMRDEMRELRQMMREIRQHIRAHAAQPKVSGEWRPSRVDGSRRGAFARRPRAAGRIR